MCVSCGQWFPGDPGCPRVETRGQASLPVMPMITSGLSQIRRGALRRAGRARHIVSGLAMDHPGSPMQHGCEVLAKARGKRAPLGDATEPSAPVSPSRRTAQPAPRACLGSQAGPVHESLVKPPSLDLMPSALVLTSSPLLPRPRDRHLPVQPPGERRRSGQRPLRHCPRACRVPGVVGP